jgi:hypothetical protein
MVLENETQIDVKPLRYGKVEKAATGGIKL